MQEVPLAVEPDGELAWIPLGAGEERRPLRAGMSLRAAGDLCHPERASARGQSGDSRAAARARLLRRLGIAESRLVQCRQVHSRNVVWLDQGADCLRCAADGILSAPGQAVLAVSVADCLPIFLADRATGRYGILHSGWKGTGILARAVEMLSSLGDCRPEDLSVTLGPGIGSCCYQVDDERYRLFLRAYGPESVRAAGGRLFLDLQGANLRILAQAGVEDVTVVRACTFCTPALSSFRRDGPSFAHMLAFIGEIPDRSAK